MELPEPVALTPREVIEQGKSPVYYRLSPDIVDVLSRSSLGAHTRWSGERDTSFTLDLLTGAAIRLGRDSAMGIWIEGGYSYVYSREHLAVLGVGLARRRRGVFAPTLALVPHVVAGRVDGESCLGARTSLIAGLSGYAFELAHQVVFVGSQPVHEMHLALTFPFTSGGE